jgi:hypothetical protein
MICPQCEYPTRIGTCENPACPEDKDKDQLALIEQAKRAAKERAAYAKRQRGIDYSLSFRKGDE